MPWHWLTSCIPSPDCCTAQLRAWGYEPVLVSCESGQGLPEVSRVLAGRTSVVAGPSGAGKSSLINALRMGRHRPDREALGIDLTGPLSLPASAAALAAPMGAVVGEEELAEGVDGEWSEGCSGGSGSVEEEEEEEVETGAGVSGRGSRPDEGPGFLKIGEMSRMGRGMHTTTAVTLIKLQDGGMLADTPGFSQPSLSRIESQDLAACFPDIQAIVRDRPCRFSDCAHVMEPGCSVNVEDGLERYPHYLKMLFDIKV
jgi:ribosome biogenesis GTPase